MKRALHAYPFGAFLGMTLGAVAGAQTFKLWPSLAGAFIGLPLGLAVAALADHLINRYTAIRFQTATPPRASIMLWSGALLIVVGVGRLGMLAFMIAKGLPFHWRHPWFLCTGIGTIWLGIWSISRSRQDRNRGDLPEVRT